MTKFRGIALLTVAASLFAGALVANAAIHKHRLHAKLTLTTTSTEIGRASCRERV